ncbi:MAG: sensor domain-containing diguanylate cyclase [Gammaproteobacteria bacterium]|nr:sensor domain-containing diguanylate cyclase [Gammaproteobacteria bacterium]NIR83483.1 sensor domain-containing diguanylate cyclase [Gammaproteobacteria bacterium]NIR91405.1 sensor domain-containing diguanylate cyclase [Gammaproteobacteria bacterium]NIU04645.1 sensor domain-containing diguanylate cyclase [Gammaproteobacteria bacterium]NIV51687.1 DUF484 family protein [Gammaproteobacteria bacterium]
MTSATTDLRAENRLLRERLQVFADEAAKNEAILRNFQALELDLLAAESLAELLYQLVEGVARALRLEEVSVTLFDPEHELRHLLVHGGVHPDELRGVFLVDDLIALNPLYAGLRKPWLGPYLGADHSPLFGDGARLRSVAILPLLRVCSLIGSLNFGSADGARYTRHHATDFLHHLAVIAAVCLENMANRERLVLSGFTDILTGWHNRRYLERRLPEEIARARRHGQPLSGLLLDVDHFKRINDAYGHGAGDRVLREFARRVSNTLRATDVTVRYGGEEFAVLLPQTALADAVELAERIRDTVADAPFAIGAERRVDVTVSIGGAEVCPGHEHASDARLGQALLDAADAALYEAKSEGRNRAAYAPEVIHRCPPLPA